MEEFIWLEKYTQNGKKVSEQRDMREATMHELRRWLRHSKSMLENVDKENPGRYLVRSEIAAIKDRVAAEINARALKKAGDNPYDLVQLMKYDSKLVMDKCKYPCTQESLISALLMKGDKFNKRRFSVKLILSFGMNFTKEEMNLLLGKIDEQTPTVTDVVNKELNLHDTTRFAKNTVSGLTFKDLGILLNIKSTEYNNLTVAELELIYNRLIGRLSEQVEQHISFWEDKINRLNSVIETKQ